jgi:P-type Cu+ transporter
VLIDKTGTLTLGRPGSPMWSPSTTRSTANVCWRSPPPPSAIRSTRSPKQSARRLPNAGFGCTNLRTSKQSPGLGVRARIAGRTITVGSRRLLPDGVLPPAAAELDRQGKTLLFVACEEKLLGVLSAMDTLRPEAPAALAELRALGVTDIELLTGDNEQTAATIADVLGVAYRANLLPQDKIAIVKAYQRQGRVVVMIGDGVNNAPALAQAEVGIAMGAAGSSIAIETADIALMQEDWHLVPEALRVARRTMAAVRFNLGFTAVYNLTGLSLAAFGILPPVIAAAARSLPDFGILANSARLLRQRRTLPSAAPTDGSLYPLLARLAPARPVSVPTPPTPLTYRLSTPNRNRLDVVEDDLTRQYGCRGCSFSRVPPQRYRLKVARIDRPGGPAATPLDETSFFQHRESRR